MDVQKVIELFIAGGLAGLITALTFSWRARRDVARDDRKQRSDEATGAASAAKAITDAAGVIVKLQDDQVEEFKLQIRALQAESSALNTRLDIEIQNRMRAEARAAINEDRIRELDNKLAAMNAQFELVEKERVSLQRENGAMKTKIYELAVGVQTLTRQLRGAGLEPEYIFEVPVTSTGRLGPLDPDAVSRYAEVR